jgi:Protein of unknown function (DUF2795)
MHMPKQDRLRALLSDVDYPCGRAELIRQAAAHGADDEVLGHLGALPDRDYAAFEAVISEFAETG